jgi:uncharacterized membrane protein
MTIKNINIVPQNEYKLGALDLVNAKYIALNLLGLVNKKCTKQINDP